MRDSAAADDRRFDESSLSPPATSGPTGAGVVVFTPGFPPSGRIRGDVGVMSRGVAPWRCDASIVRIKREETAKMHDAPVRGSMVFRGRIRAMHDAETRRRIHERKRAIRARRIDELQAKARRSGGTDDRRFWCLSYDLHHAPWTTNLEQLREIGVDPWMPSALGADEVGPALREVVEGLAVLQVFLVRTDHLDDRACYRRLRLDVLLDRVRDVPPATGSREWIDLAGGIDRSAELAVHATDAERESLRASGVIVPPRMSRRADRDRWLPRPGSR